MRTAKCESTHYNSNTSMFLTNMRANSILPRGCSSALYLPEGTAQLDWMLQDRARMRRTTSLPSMIQQKVEPEGCDSLKNSTVCYFKGPVLI